MKKLSCKDVGGNDDFVAEGETEQEVMDKMIAHVKEMHSEMVEEKSDEEMMKMKDTMKEKITDA